MITMAIDPGCTQSSYVTLLDGVIMCQEDLPNEDLLCRILDLRLNGDEEIVCEMVAHYGSGMPAGKEVFETCRWIGRFEQAAFHESIPFHLVYRMQVKMHLCGDSRAKDGNVRQALIDLMGPPFVKREVEKTNRKGQVKIVTVREPGPTYGLSKHRWQALAVGVTWNAIRPKEEAA